MTADDIIGVLGWLALGLAYAWAVWSLARPRRDAPVSGSPPTRPRSWSCARGVAAVAKPRAEPEDDLERADVPSRRASGF